jgi:MYXO-CTERM domain-containing protein
VVVANTNPDEVREVTLVLPAGCDGEWICHRLGGDALDNNEDAVAVEIEEIACPTGQPLVTPAGSLTTVRIGEEAPSDDDDSGDDDDSSGDDDDDAQDDDTAGDDDASGDCACSGDPDSARVATVLGLLTALGAALGLRRRAT